MREILLELHTIAEEVVAGMKIVLKQHPSFEIDIISEAESLALRRWYENSANSGEENTALGVIRSTHARDGWIACDCLEGAMQPLLAPMRFSGGYTLKRLTRADGDPLAREDRPNHSESCPFRFDKVLGSERADMRFVVRPMLASETAYFDGLPAFAERLAKRDTPRNLAENTRSDRLSALGLQLWRLLDGARINALPPLQEDGTVTPTLTSQLTRIKDHSKTLRVLRTRRLSSLMTTWAKDLFDPESYWQQNFRSAIREWPKTQRPTAFMIAFTKLIGDQTVYPVACEQPIPVATRIRRPLRGDPKNRGPFLTILNFDAGDENDGPLRAVQAYAQPIHSADTLLPVESGFEREVLDILLQVRRRLFEAVPQLRIGIVKPLFAIATPQGPCRPDFLLLLSTPSMREPRPIIVEAMGFDTPEYEATKTVTLPRMRLIGPVFEIRPTQIVQSKLSETGKLLFDWVSKHANT